MIVIYYFSISLYMYNMSYSHINEIFCKKETRVVQNGELVSFNGNRYLVAPQNGISRFKETVEVREYRNGMLKIYFQGEELEYELFGIKGMAA